ncbi:RNA-directed DNA polymerase [Flavobacterium sp. UBA6195]|uniref:RNA-directed DNA polymerase n=1 Tax=Flavobacterium sp. UBA6195 TaxID=1946554 RepID=UPI0025C3BD47|nr:RNA-directed DNA polymerase [Flavobacterium sp. UBA6195]
MQTDRFNRLRKEILSDIFSKKKIKDTWRKIVREQLRNLDLKDLFDHYDLNYNLDDRAQAVRNDILSGNYQVSQPLIYRIEKKLGICRHLVIPQPIDALVLQVLVEYVAEEILNNQPSKNAFYSRDKNNVKLPHQLDNYNLSWRRQWKQLQKHIYNFQSQRELIAVTDLTNYYDSIYISELRKVFSSYAKIDEVLVDLLFKVIEGVSWKPDYLPYSEKGLPTTNLEGIRLLAHCFLFEMDSVLKERTDDSFTRWMDDIVFASDNRKDAIETLSAISDILKSRGLALNIAKTNIYNEEQGFFHFQIEANRYIDSIETVKKTDTIYNQTCKNLHSKFKQHLRDTSPKYWDKIAKRYITTYGKLNSKSLLYILPEVYINFPGLRQNLIYYLSTIGYTKQTAKAVLLILEKIDVFDDISLYQICLIVTDWQIPVNDESKKFLKELEQNITEFSKTRKIPSDFYCILWFKAKYNHPETLLDFIEKYQYIWQADTFLRRQVTAILSRLLITNNSSVFKLLNNQITSGVNNTVTLANQLYFFRNLTALDQKLNYYLFPPKMTKPYSLNRFLVLCSVLNSEVIRKNKDIQKKVLEYVKDPYFRKWLETQYNIS